MTISRFSIRQIAKRLHQHLNWRTEADRLSPEQAANMRECIHAVASRT
jgi:hypothetical protein